MVVLIYGSFAYIIVFSCIGLAFTYIPHRGITKPMQVFWRILFLAIMITGTAIFCFVMVKHQGQVSRSNQARGDQRDNLAPTILSILALTTGLYCEISIFCTPWCFSFGLTEACYYDIRLYTFSGGFREKKPLFYDVRAYFGSLVVILHILGVVLTFNLPIEKRYIGQFILFSAIQIFNIVKVNPGVTGRTVWWDKAKVL
ncbi:hypothetical protein DM02DRAFT_657136 [Periconia macrospinosa]|uniref:Uncharacterized protein n=1 Tax=Periconia macrospinosa TaxID=97972 RepID=A0A2V1DLV4_9PLEO|nr:hypothetical protein DM02DRAFT_657136 [Periconia macrospinosa]